MTRLPLPRAPHVPTTADPWRRPFTAGERTALAAETLVAYARARRAMRSERVETATRHMRAGVVRPAGRSDEDERFAAIRLAHAVARVMDRLPTDSRCLVTALTLTAVLSRRGIESTLVIGVQPAPEFAAHAWIEYEGAPILPAGGPAMERLVAV